MQVPLSNLPVPQVVQAAQVWPLAKNPLWQAVQIWSPLVEQLSLVQSPMAVQAAQVGGTALVR